MSVKYLLDTNILSEPLKPRPNQAVLAKIRKNQDEIGIASVVWHELLFGCYRLPESERRTAIEAYLFDVVLSSIPILPYDERAAHWHALERARLARLGKTPPFADGQIAAVARVANATLITANTSDYADFEGLQIEDWRAG